jgi:hypothetical protein
VEIVPFSRTRPGADKLKERVKGEVFIQAPGRFQAPVKEFVEGLLPDELLLKEISKRSGEEDPEKLFWVPVVFQCKVLGVHAELVEPDIDKVLAKAAKELSLKGPDLDRVRQEARLWFLSGSGYIRHFYDAFDMLFFWLPWRVRVRKAWLRACAFVVNLIPGDQQDVMAMVAKANSLLAVRLAKALKGKKGVAFIDEDIAADVARTVEEL